MPEVSVIIPNYNHSPYLRERIDSVLNQTYTDFELIVLDDCSTDNSHEIMEQYRGHKQIAHIVYNDTNSGSTFRQWKKGLELARGRWIWIAESDDVAEPTFLERLLTIARNENRDIGFVFCASQTMDYQSRLLPAVVPGWENDSYLPPHAGLGGRFLTQNSVPNASAVLAKKTALLAELDDASAFRLNGDWLVWSRLAWKWGMYYTSQPLNRFRQHEKTTRSHYSKMGINILEYGNLLRAWTHDRLITDDELQEGLVLLRTWWLGNRSLSFGASLSIRNLAARLKKEKHLHTPDFSYFLFLKTRLPKNR